MTGVDGYGDDSSDVDELEELLNDFFCRRQKRMAWMKSRVLVTGQLSCKHNSSSYDRFVRASAMSSRPSETRERVGFDEATLRRPRAAFVSFVLYNANLF